MICKCGAEMRHQSQGVWFCSKGDYFAVALLTPDGVGDVQWYAPEGGLETWESFNKMIKDNLNAAYVQRERRYPSWRSSTQLLVVKNTSFELTEGGVE